jgi:hypothetical protein
MTNLISSPFYLPLKFPLVLIKSRITLFLCVPGEALYDMKLKLNTSDQLSDWNENQVNPCTWDSVICDNNNNNVVQVYVEGGTLSCFFSFYHGNC